MKKTVFYCLAAIAALFTGTIDLRAQEVPFADLANPNFQPYSREIRDQADSVTLCNGSSSWCAMPRLEASASLLFLQPGAGNLEYGTLVFPFPAASPHWINQSIVPSYNPAFNIGFRYIVPETCNDLRSSWTHLDTSDSASFAGDAVTNFAGPAYLIGPGASVYNLGAGTVNFNYDAVNFEAGHLFRGGQAFQVRVFGGLQYASIDETITGRFSDNAGTNTQTNITDSEFSGVGPRLGMNAQLNRRNFQFIGDMAVCALIGSQQLRQDFNTVSPTFPAGNPQSFTSPDATQVVPGLDTKIGAAYSFPIGRGIFKFEAGYQAVAYINAINYYQLTQVATPPAPQSVGVFMATAEHLQSTFTAHGPYLSGSFAF